MVSKKFKELRRKISDHYYNEAEIMLEMIESKISEKEMTLLREFMLNHPYARIADKIERRYQLSKMSQLS